MAAAGVADGRDALRRAAALRGQGGRPRRRQGRLHLRDRRAARRGPARGRSAFEGPIVIEELLAGDEISVFALCDGQRVVPLAPAQDFKRIGDGDTGPNTGGMGSYSPVPGFGAIEVAELVEQIHRPGGRGARPPRRAVRRRALRRADADGVGAEGARVQRALRRPGDAVDPAAPRRRPPRRARGCGRRRPGRGRARRLRRGGGDGRARRRAAIRSERTRARRSRGSRTRRRPARSSSTPGRRCAASGWSRTAAASSASPATGATVAEARERAYAGCERIRFDGMQYRRDIALDAAAAPG